MKKHFSLSVSIISFMYTQSAFAADEIIVTATRSEMKVKEYAGSVSVLNQHQLEIISAIHPAEALNEIAGVNIHRNSGQEHLTAIRSPVLTGGAGAGSFLYLEDGVPLRSAGFSNVNGLFEGALELAGGVEVTKGPGSVLYGSNAVHGLINILSQTPTETSTSTLDILGNDDGYVRLKTSMSGEALSGLYSVATSFAHDNGFRESSGFDQQKIQLRYDQQAGNWSLKTLATFQNLNQETAGFIKGVDAYKDRALSLTNPNPEAFRDGKSVRLAVHLNKQIDSQTKLSLIPYARWLDLTFRRHFVPGKALEDSGHKSIGLLTSYEGTSKAVAYTFGFDSEYTKGFLREFQPGPSVFSFVQGEHFDYKVNATVLSPYTQLRFNLGTKTKLNLGARADYTHYDYRNNINSGQFGRFIRIPDQKDDYLTISPKIDLVHTINNHINSYVRLARGSRAPQITDAYSLQINQAAGEIKPETIDSFELGLKGNINTVDFELAGFAMKKDNFFFRNANGFNVEDGKTEHIGVELSFNAPLTNILELSGSFTLANHTYAFSDIVTSASSSIIEGKQIDTAPNTLGFMQLKASPSETLNIFLKWQHMGDYFTDPGSTAKYTGHDIFTLRSTYKIKKNMSIYGRVDNLFDTTYADRADFAFGSHRYFPGRPRTAFLGVKIQTN